MDRQSQLVLNLGLIAIISILAIGIAIITHHANAEIQTDKTNYDSTDIIVITGHVDGTQNKQVIVKVTNENGDIVGMTQQRPDENGDYKKTFLPSGPLWINGTFTISEQYGNESSTTTFYLGDNAPGISKSSVISTPVFSESNATNLQPVFSESNSTQISFGESNSTVINAVSQVPIPTWVKGVFGYWAEGKISDNDLVQALQFLIKVGIINVG